jgi:hypothetical protein
VSEIVTGFASTPGGVLTVEVGAITGDLELLTRPTPDGRRIEALVRYGGALDPYTVAGSPVRSVSGFPDQGEHRAAQDRLLQALGMPAPIGLNGNERPVDFRGL